MADIVEFHLEGKPFIALYQLLKVEGLCESGAMAKHCIEQGLVQVNGVVELQKRKKITSGMSVSFSGQQLSVVD